MKKLLLCTLASVSLSCLSVPVRINLITDNNVHVRLIGERHDPRIERDGAVYEITTPFRLVDDAILVQLNEGNRNQLIREALDQPGLLEFVNPVPVPGITPEMLRQAVAWITEPGHDVNQLGLPTVTQLINAYDYLGVSWEIINTLLKRAVTLAIQDPLHCPFARGRSDLETLQNGNLIKAARRLVAEQFNQEILVNQPWREVTRLEGHASGVNSVAWSPDNRYIASGSYDKTVRIWDVNTREMVGDPLRHDDIVYSVSWSPDGRYIASGSWDRTVRIWDVNTRQMVGEPLRHDGWVSSVAWSPDSRYIASGSYDKTVRILDVNTRQMVGGPLRHDSWVRSVTWSPDSRYIASSSGDRIVRIWSREWDWPNWLFKDQFDATVDYDGNLLKQLLMLRFLDNPRLTPAEIAGLRPLYDELPASARAWIDERTGNALQ